MHSAGWLMAAVILLSGCRSEVSFPVPPQRTVASHRISEILDMTGTRPVQAWASMVSGVQPAVPNADWRWVSTHPEFRFQLDKSIRWGLAVRITSAKVALTKTGPQHATFRVNGETAGSATLDHEGRYDFEFPVAPAVLEKATPAIVTMEFDPCMAQTEGPPLCVLMHTVGFVQEQP